MGKLTHFVRVISTEVREDLEVTKGYEDAYIVALL